jgi:fermentation-respiration switch protein FrsA (DUF1100 family)
MGRRIARHCTRIMIEAFVAAVFILPFAVIATNLFRSRSPTLFNPGQVGLKYEDVRFSTPDGKTLAGWWIPATVASDRTMLVCHGVGANRDDLIRFYRFIQGLGFHILSWDWRGHGLSDWSPVTFGHREKVDVRTALDWLRATHGGESKWVAAFAISMGASIVLQAAPQCPEIRAFVLDSPFASIRTMLPSRFSMIPGPLRVPVCFLAAFYARLLMGVSVDDVAPIATVASLSPRPIFMVHGTADKVIPYEETQRLSAAALEPKEVWIVPGGEHVNVLHSHTEEYRRRVTAFVLGALERDRVR